MNRRDFLKATPIAALTPVAVAEGVARYDLEPAGHFIFFVDMEKVDIESLATAGCEQVPLMPKGSKGGWIIGVYGDVDKAVRIFRLDEKPDSVVKRMERIDNG